MGFEKIKNIICLLIVFSLICGSFQTISAYTTVGVDLSTNESIVSAVDYCIETSSDLFIDDSVPGYDGYTSVRIEAGSFAEWSFNVKEQGHYRLELCYFPLPGNSQFIERNLTVNGNLPSAASATIRLNRQWIYTNDIKTDINRNEIRPGQSDSPGWMKAYASGLQISDYKPYEFYFSEGENRISLSGGQESFTLAWFRIYQENDLPDYDSYHELLLSNEAESAEGEAIKIQAELPQFRSDPSINMQYDRTSPITEGTNLDHNTSELQLNSIGGNNWRFPGQWMQWKVEVKNPGLYKIAIRYKQNYTNRTTSYRALYINDKIPFKEAAMVPFKYSINWQTGVLGENWLFYLKAGENTIRLENVVGKLSNVLGAVQETVFELNRAYRRILMVTGSRPDPNRDYNLDKELPEIMAVLNTQGEVLRKTADDLLNIAGERGVTYGRLQKAAVQLESFVTDPDSIPERMDQFRSTISDLASWTLSTIEQPLLLDYLYFMTEDNEIPKSDASIFSKIIFEALNFIKSFISDYNVIGASDDKIKKVELWMGTSGLAGAAQLSVAGASGRDQAQILKEMTADTFSPDMGISVNIRLVDMSVLLAAVASGGGPDIAINQEQTNPVNYGLRGALYDLNDFPDCENILERFADSAYEPFRLGDSLFALPETQTFSMLFCRSDILDELDITFPKTWQDIYHSLTILNRNNLKIGLPNIQDNNLDVFYMLLYQSGGSIYNQSKTLSDLRSDAAVEAFIRWSDFYTKYNVEQKIDALTRFRTGENPIMIAPFTFYNILTSSAPEIKGLWTMIPLPGSDKGSEIDRSAVSASTAAVIFANTEDPVSSWEFLKWWTSEDSQYNFANEIEILLGEAARWPTANITAFKRLGWKQEVIESLDIQKNDIIGLPELPGSYMTNRYLTTAIRLVINNGLDPREAILDYSKKIDEEITRKRMEFGLE